MVAETEREFDYIIVGSGSAGGVLTEILSRDPSLKVLCLEAGTKGAGYIYSRPPAGVAYMIENPDVNWCYQSEPNETHGNRAIPTPRGKILGGSSAINGTIYNRGQKGDYDTWAQLGNAGWGYDDVLPHFRDLETADMGEDKYRGRKGRLRVTLTSKVTGFYDLFFAAANKAGIPTNHDYSGASQFGIAMAQQTVARGMRQSTATQFLAPAKRRANVEIRQGAEVQHLILEGKSCTGLVYSKNGAKITLRARREVILCAGASNTPKILELSGIGQPELLARHGIECRHALPGVGENLRDHFAAVLKWRLNKPGLSLAQRGRGWRLGIEVLRFGLLRSGFISQGMGSLRLFTRSHPGVEDADGMMVVAPYLIEIKNGSGRAISPVEGFFMFVHGQRPESTGSIHIRSKDPAAPPAINFRFLETENDRRVLLDTIRIARNIVAQSPMRDVIAEEMAPGPDITDDEAMLEWVRNTGTITQHMIGSCRMGQDAMAVVDNRLRVHGITGLRIADASVMPVMISGNTSIPCMMIGSKCAELIAEDNRAGQSLRKTA